MSPLNSHSSMLWLVLIMRVLYLSLTVRASSFCCTLCRYKHFTCTIFDDVKPLAWTL